MEAFTLDQWLILALVFLLGMFVGMALRGSSKWKRRYREEVRRREALEADRTHAEARDIAAHARDEPAPR